MSPQRRSRCSGAVVGCLGPRYAQRILADLTAAWVRHLPLLEGEGNFGSVAGENAADPQYTQVRLSRMAELALASERGAVGPLPLDLIEGSMYRGGGLPPFDPALTIRALLVGAGSAGTPRTRTGSITADPTRPCVAAVARRSGISSER